MSLPIQNSNGFKLSVLYSCMLENNVTVFLFGLGISIPMEDFPSITSTTLTLLTASDLAKSLAILET